MMIRKTINDISKIILIKARHFIDQSIDDEVIFTLPKMSALYDQSLNDH